LIDQGHQLEEFAIDAAAETAKPAKKRGRRPRKAA
jgi:hypothetical protein